MRYLLLVSLTACGLGHDSSLYRIDCDDDTIDCPTSDHEYITDNKRYRCHWACRDDREVNYYFKRDGGCWEFDRATDGLCEGAEPPCGFFCLLERECRRHKTCEDVIESF